MRSSAVLALFGATLAVAAPAHQALHKKAIITDIVTDIVYITVTAGDLPATTSKKPEPTNVVVVQATHVRHKPHTKVSKVQSTSTTAPPPPPPTTSSTPPPPPPTTSSTPPPPPPTVAPAPSPSSSAPVQVQSAAPVEQEIKAPEETESKPTDYQSTALYHHKMHRANHTANPLTWDNTLAKYAKTTANTCKFAHDMGQGGGGYGQNLAAYGTTANMDNLNLATVVGDAISNQWYYGEAANVPYGVDNPNINGPEFLHFTQVVWKDTTTVGCYTAKCGAGTIFSYHSLYTVCNYKTAGNVLGAFASQVTKPIDTQSISATIS